ncbi:hypothetical protein PMIN01_00896 [Paraphaeosphaeria minitans]|uniref:Uncharacterized protein n=1 Tax=Paraphaeosphaeria minitans TaxID=565426 RepID=A0A9P6GT39_9PLEO|nr:hypothetical protein PMIN01_00896 [Paraphaeosphaeria minitans]
MLCRDVRGDLLFAISVMPLRRSTLTLATLVHLTRLLVAPPMPWFRSSRLRPCVLRSFHGPGPRSGAASPVLPSSRAHRRAFRWLGVTK